MKKIFSLVLCLCAAAMMWADKTVTITATVPAEVNVLYAVGGWSWEFVDANLMTEVTANATATTKFFTIDRTVPDDAETRTNYNFKFCAGPGWGFQQKTADGADYDFFANGEQGWNCTITNFQAYFTPSPLISPKLYVTTSPNIVALYIAGSFQEGGWSASNNPMTFDEENSNDETHVFYYQFENIDPALIEFKVIAGPDWAYEPVASANHVLANEQFEDGDYFMIVGDSEFKKIYDPTNVGSVVVTVTAAPAGTQTIFMVGGFNGWSLDSAIEMTNNGDGTWTGTIANIEQTEMKFLGSRGWDYQESANGVEGTEHANRLVNFKTCNGVYQAEILGWKTALPVDATALDNIAADKAVKVIINGQLFIIRDGVRYNALGAVVE